VKLREDQRIGGNIIRSEERLERRVTHRQYEKKEEGGGDRLSRMSNVRGILAQSSLWGVTMSRRPSKKVVLGGEGSSLLY